jgi:hypothetical protein
MQAGKADKHTPTHATGVHMCCALPTAMYSETAQHSKQVSSVTLPLHTRLGTHAQLSLPTVVLLNCCVQVSYAGQLQQQHSYDT